MFDKVKIEKFPTKDVQWKTSEHYKQQEHQKEQRDYLKHLEAYKSGKVVPEQSNSHSRSSARPQKQILINGVDNRKLQKNLKIQQN